MPKRSIRKSLSNKRSILEVVDARIESIENEHPSETNARIVTNARISNKHIGNSGVDENSISIENSKDIENSETKNKTSSDKIIDDVDNINFLGKPINEKKFRLNAQKVFFTYKSHIDCKKLINFIGKLNPIKEWCFAQETSDKSHAYEHCHIAICFVKKLCITSSRHFDYKGIHPNIGSIKNWFGSLAYLVACKSKPNPIYWTNLEDIQKLLLDNPRKIKDKDGFKAFCDRIIKHKNKFEAIRNEGDYQTVMAIEKIYNAKVIEDDPRCVNYFSKMELKDWQNDLKK